MPRGVRGEQVCSSCQQVCCPSEEGVAPGSAGRDLVRQTECVCPGRAVEVGMGIASREGT